MKTSEIIITIIALAAISTLIFFGMQAAFNGQEKYECTKWQSEAEQYKGYWITGWQAAQCQHHNIQINAPVQK